jgi:hypothetical protein
MNKVLPLAILIALTAAASGQGVVATSAPRDGSPFITLDGTVTSPGYVSLSQLKDFPQASITLTQQTDHGSVSSSFTGALLWTVIGNSGWKNGTEKNAYLRHTILVRGKDGYAAALSEGEIDPRLEGKQVILAWQMDGQPLAAPELVVPGDAHAARRVHDVTQVEVQ